MLTQCHTGFRVHILTQASMSEGRVTNSVLHMKRLLHHFLASKVWFASCNQILLLTLVANLFFVRIKSVPSNTPE